MYIKTQIRFQFSGQLALNRGTVIVSTMKIVAMAEDFVIFHLTENVPFCPILTHFEWDGFYKI